MKVESWLIILLSICLCLFIPYWYKTTQIETQAKESIAEERLLTAACKDALSKTENVDSLLFDNQETRDFVIDEFYDTYNQNKNNRNKADQDAAMNQIPCLALVDWNGFYLEYPSLRKDSDGMTYSYKSKSLRNTWSKDYGPYNIEYTLTDIITVRSKTSEQEWRGLYTSIYKMLKKDNTLTFMDNEKNFLEERNNVILSIITDQLNYTVNTHNLANNLKKSSYAITLPQGDNDMRTRLLKRPCIFAFSQGNQEQMKMSYANVFSLVSADKIERKSYGIKEESGELLYHEIKEGDWNTYIFIGSMEECAKRGANPCYKCVP